MLLLLKIQESFWRQRPFKNGCDKNAKGERHSPSILIINILIRKRRSSSPLLQWLDHPIWWHRNKEKQKEKQKQKCQTSFRIILILFLCRCMHGFPLLAMILGSPILRIRNCHVSKFLWEHVNLGFVLVWLAWARGFRIFFVVQVSNFQALLHHFVLLLLSHL